MSLSVSLAVVRHAFALRGVDPLAITQSPHDGAFRIPGPSGGHVRIVAVEPETTRSGWSYTVLNRFGVVIDDGGTTSVDLGDLWPGLARHLRAGVAAPLSAVPRQRHALADLGSPASHPPFELQPHSPAARWILALYQEWRVRCTTAPDGAQSATRGAPLTAGDLLRDAFAAIGLPADLDLDALAVRVAASTAGDGHPAAAVLAAHLDRVHGPGDDHDTLAAELVDALTDAGLLISGARPIPAAVEGNEHRAAHAVSALEAVRSLGGALRPCYRDPDVLLAVAGDLIADLCHLADRAGLDPAHLLDSGAAHHREQAAARHDHATCSIPECWRCDPGRASGCHPVTRWWPAGYEQGSAAPRPAVAPSHRGFDRSSPRAGGR